MADFPKPTGQRDHEVVDGLYAMIIARTGYP
jgi:hypothetical protein